ncbi:MAG: TfuA-like protein, partial [Vulcanimicrobiaceae bacterium]
MTAFVFLGPSLPKAEAERLLDAVYLDPVAMGDLYLLVETRAHPGDYIAIIDGFFEQRPAVWHKEILFALSRGIHVYGAASMGALRASELHTFGMEGVGRIFEAYRDGVIEDDDEVAVAHATGEHGFRVLSDSMVGIRFKLEALVRDGLVPMTLAQDLIGRIKMLPYGDRAWATVIEETKRRGVASSIVEAIERAKRLPDAKSEDARALLRLLSVKVTEGQAEPFHAGFTLQNTSYWSSLMQNMAMQVQAVRQGDEQGGDDQRGAISAIFRAG